MKQKGGSDDLLSSSRGKGGCEHSSWNRPLLHDIPEGIRLISVLASARRRDHYLLLPTLKGDNEVNVAQKGKQQTLQQSDNGADEDCLKVELEKQETQLSIRWKQLETNEGNGTVYVPDNSVVSAVSSMDGPIEFFCVAGNTLEVRGGSLKVDDLTLLPPGRLFVLLSFLTFGIQPFNFLAFDASTLAERSLAWLEEWEDLAASNDVEKKPIPVRDAEKIDMAIRFHELCQHMDETLVCHGEKVSLFCQIFDGVGGCDCKPWDTSNDPFAEALDSMEQPPVKSRLLEAKVKVKVKVEVKAKAKTENTEERIDKNENAGTTQNGGKKKNKKNKKQKKKKGNKGEK
eukprot:CAMPEP_0116831658 /NCGR_PEP_ID=MMETSP0418-20121206/5463_1 /TAXON_ID=1158023 /ORGANISM="Astrosyne radiata, Strain 13vi08-1A" /LENGTH=343 /DNA_ID=CAMNT_0004460941 /DNA_START=29 /DNA_END=1060 /DNA_ORIENTATION=+